MEAIPNIFHVLAIFLEYPLRTVWGIIPALLAAIPVLLGPFWAFQDVEPMVLQEMEPFPIQQVVLGISLHSQKYLQKSIHVNMPSLFRGNSSGLCAFMFCWFFFFFHNLGDFLSMCFCLWVSAVLAGAGCCRMSGLASLVALLWVLPCHQCPSARRCCPAGARKTWAVPKLVCLSTSSESCFHQVTHRMLQRSWEILEEKSTALKLGFGYVELFWTEAELAESLIFLLKLFKTPHTSFCHLPDLSVFQNFENGKVFKNKLE